MCRAGRVWTARAHPGTQHLSHIRRDAGNRQREGGGNSARGGQRSREMWDRELERGKRNGCLGTVVEMTSPRLDGEQQNTRQTALAPVVSSDTFMKPEEELRWWYCFLRRSVNQGKDAQGRAFDFCSGLVLLSVEFLEAAVRSWY